MKPTTVKQVSVAFMIIATVAIALHISSYMQPKEPVWCNMSYVTRDNCDICSQQIEEINSANMSCVIPVLDDGFRYYSLVTLNRTPPFWILPNGAIRNDLFSTTYLTREFEN